MHGLRTIVLLHGIQLLFPLPEHRVELPVGLPKDGVDEGQRTSMAAAASFSSSEPGSRPVRGRIRRRLWYLWTSSKVPVHALEIRADVLRPMKTCARGSTL